tara:strand:+ start:377 stop:568 length:192 start_codon:yes stop_codon:yes gene_type:complete
MYYASQQGMTPKQIREFYRSQLRKFESLGIGGVTDNGVTVTETLINATKRRLSQLVMKTKGKI